MDMTKWLEELSALGAGGAVAVVLFWFYRKDVVQAQQRIEQRLTDILAAVQRLHDALK